MAYLRLPDNSYFTIPEGATPQQAYALARQKYPEAFEPPKPKDTGFTGAFKAGVEELKGDIGALAGRTGLMDEAAAEKYREEKQRKAKEIFEPTQEGWSEAPFLKARELLGGSIPYTLAPIAAAGVGTLAAPAAPLIATGAALGAGALQYTGTNLGRQMEDGRALKDTDLLAAGAAAIPQAALDTLSFRMIPGIGRIFGAAGKQITPEVAKAIASQGMLKTAGAYALQGAKTAGIEGATEVAQQFLERLQAGLDIADEKARDEYFESFIGGAVLGGTLSVPGKFMERGGAKQVARAEEQRLRQEENLKLQQEKAAEQAAEEQAQLIAAQQKTIGVQQTGDLFGERPLTKPLKDLTPRIDKTGEYTNAEGEKVPQYAAAYQPSTTVRERERAAQEAGVETPTRNELLQQRSVLAREAADLQVQRDAAAEKGDTTSFAAFAKRFDQMDKALGELDKEIKAMPVTLTPDMEMAQLRGELKNYTKQLSKQVGPAYDSKVALALADKIQKAEARINELAPAASQFEMFDPAEMQAAQNRAIRGEKEARAQEQLDLFAAQKQPQLTRADEYLKGLQELEDAYAEGKSERIIDELVAKLQQVAEEKEAGKVGIPSGVAQEGSIQRIERIKRAIAAEEAKLEDATTNEEVATIRADIAALKQRYANALVESSTPQAENIRSVALEDGQNAIGDLQSAVEDLKSGRYFNGRDAATAESFRSGIEAKAYDAINAYVDAAIRDVNAQRALNNQESLTTTEALKLTNDLKSHLSRVVQFKNVEGLMRPEYRQQQAQLLGALTGDEAMKMRRIFGEYKRMKAEGKLTDVYSQVEKQAAQIKNKYSKGAPKRNAGEKPFALEQETLPAALRAKAAKEKLAELPKGFSEKDAKDLARLEKERADLDDEKPSMAVAKRAKELDAQIKDLRERAGRYLAVFGEETKKEKQEALNKAYNDAKAKIGEEAEAGRAAEEKTAAEKAKQEEVDYERYAPSGISPDQKDLFAAKDLEPVAVVRSTPEKFMKFLGSAQVMKAKAKLKALDTQIKKAQELSKKTPQVDKDFIKQLEEQRRFVLELQNEDKIVAGLRKKAISLWREAAGDPARLKTIDDLHAQANALVEAAKDLKLEKAILDSMERKLNKIPKASPAALKLEKDLARARAQAGELEAIQQKMLEDQVKDKRLAEQQLLETTQGLGKTRQEIVETNRALPGKDEKLQAKRLTKVEPAKTAAEKTAKVVAEEKERAEERKAFREQVGKGLSAEKLKERIDALQEAIDLNKEKGQLNAAKKKEGTLKRLMADYKSKMDVARMAMRGLDEKKTAQPPKMKTGVAPEKRGRKAKADFEQEALDHGVKFDDYEFVRQGLAFGNFKAREEAAKTGAGITHDEAKKIVAGVKVPKGLKIVVLNKLSGELRAAVEAQGMNPDTVRGGVMPNGGVFIVAENHTDIKDLQKTLAHEITGHVGVEGLLGEAGMNALIKKIGDRDAVMKLAEKLGVGQDAMAAYAAAKRIGKTEAQALGTAVREMIAHTEEARVDKNFLAKANEFIKAIVGAVRAALRKMGIDLDINTSDVFKILRDARSDFNAVAPGAYVNKDGDIMFRPGPAVANDDFKDVLGYTDRFIAKQKPWLDTIRGANAGLIFKTKYIDRFAPVERVLEAVKDSLKATQLMYFLRMHDQRMAWTAETTSTGAPKIVEKKRPDGSVERIIETQPGANLKDMAVALRDADVGNAEATNRVFTLYMAALRAKRVGLDKLNFGPDVTEKMLKETLDAVERNKKTKAAFEKAADIYNEYNVNLVNFAVQTGAIPKDVAKLMLSSKDYVPFYRARNDGTVVLEIGGAPAFKIGNLKDQPYLHELVGGDEAILDIFTSAVQNTSMMMDMSLRNLATRNVAFTLGEMGYLEKGEKEKGIGIRKGDGTLGPKTIRFKIDGENHFAVVNTDAADVPAELLVKGLEGVNTALPNAVKMMNIPANLLRKWVTRNPAYALRQVVRDPLNAVMVSGADTMPIVSSLKEIAKMVQGKSEGEPLLQRRGILGGQVLTGTAEDQKQILTQITSGKKGWDYYMAKADQLAIQGDAATRVVMYNSFIKQGLSEMEATLATLEAMNFSKRGTSPSLFALSTMVPFMNAQIQGLNVLWQAYKGNMPFNEKLRVKQKLFQRLTMMAGFTMLYAALMQDDEAYKNANDEEKYNNWFVYLPFLDEPVKVPIPFELGLIGKAVPEALMNTIWGDEKARDTGTALAKMVWNSVPISGPQGIKPALEVALNHSFYSWREIESDRLSRFEPGERYNDRTSEIAKSIGKSLNISPIKIEYLIRGYTGSVPLAVASLANPVLSSGEAGVKPAGRPSELPLVGTFFQPTDAAGLVNKAYKDVEEINQVKETWKKMEEEGRYKEADAYLDANADTIALASLAGRFRQRMGELTKQERQVRADPTLSAEEKRKELDAIRQDKIDLAKELSSVRG